MRSIDLTDNHMLLRFAERVLSLSCTPAAVQSPSKRSFSATDMHLSRLDGITSPLKRQRNISSNNPASPVLVSLQSTIIPIPLPLTTATSPLSLTAGDSDTSPVLVPVPVTVQPNTSATVPAGAQAQFPWKYACDMVPQLQLFVNLSDDQMIQALFATTCPTIELPLDELLEAEEAKEWMA
ncbi:hypothetical protein AZE42_12082 [Rhizopogon vesiculosus]|uniref:Uncharacterized protein n=1 Tax=Rhizopogon vesiculosus TaxID=180088 RepID=A0A1J8PMU1_9AGAM|nr:hypothetical protein AZE42_12082 [Rhizopogon vesiculosus]